MLALLAMTACDEPSRVVAPQPVDPPLQAPAKEGDLDFSVSTWPRAVIADFETELEAVPVSRDRIVSLEWRFNDGTLARGSKIRHTFDREGVTAVLVRATTETGLVLQRQVVVQVSPGIAALGTVLSGVVPGGLHTCAIDAAAALYCWGYNGNGTIGDGTRQHHYSPIRVGSSLSLSQVATGVGHSCALTDVGAAYCWGKNESGQLGDGTTIDRDVPTAVLGGLTFSSIDIGNNHSCALTQAGVAYCWGADASGQLGNGIVTGNQLQPALVLGGVAFSVIRAGYTHSCALQQVTGFAYCWGSNNTGQIGNGTGGNSNTDMVDAPALVSGGNAFAQLDIGASHTCGLLANTNASNKTWCWGWNGNGQLGASTSEVCRSTVPCARTPQKLPSSVKLVAITAGSKQTCGITSTGQAYCWGGNSYGELGDGTTVDKSSPVAIPNLQFKSIRAGRYFTCGVLLDNTSRCWGYNFFGMLGLGDNADRLTPTQVPGLSF